MKEIQLMHGKIAFVDDEDFEYLNQFIWYYYKTSKHEYARRFYTSNKKQLQMYMHREILNPEKHYIVDHKDGNGLNNQRFNIRICNESQNAMNKCKRLNCTSKYKGVYKNNKNQWIAQIRYNNTNYRLGSYLLEKNAALVYNIKALELYGEFAKLNDV